MRHHPQDVEQFPLGNSYRIEEATFLKSFNPVPISEIPFIANVINSHVLCNIKQNDGSSLSLKAEIAPHENDDVLKNVLASDCTTSA